MGLETVLALIEERAFCNSDLPLSRWVRSALVATRPAFGIRLLILFGRLVGVREGGGRDRYSSRRISENEGCSWKQVPGETVVPFPRISVAL